MKQHQQVSGQQEYVFYQVIVAENFYNIVKGNNEQDEGENGVGFEKHDNGGVANDGGMFKRQVVYCSRSWNGIAKVIFCHYRATVDSSMDCVVFCGLVLTVSALEILQNFADFIVQFFGVEWFGDEIVHARTENFLFYIE